MRSGSSRWMMVAVAGVITGMAVGYAVHVRSGDLEPAPAAGVESAEESPGLAPLTGERLAGARAASRAVAEGKAVPGDSGESGSVGEAPDIRVVDGAPVLRDAGGVKASSTVPEITIKTYPLPSRPGTPTITRETLPSTTGPLHPLHVDPTTTAAPLEVHQLQTVQ